MCAAAFMCALAEYGLCLSTWARWKCSAGTTPTLSGTWGTLGHSVAWTPTVAIEQPTAHLCVSLQL